jgi:hypothetical protein
MEAKRVICEHDEGTALCKGKEYTVKEVRQSDNAFVQCFYFRLNEPVAGEKWYSEWRFAVIDPTPVPTPGIR